MSVRKLAAAAAISVSALFVVLPAQAQSVTCDTIAFTGQVGMRFPNANDYCLEVVNKDGKDYAHFTAEFVRRTGSEIVMRFKNRSGGYGEDVSIRPPEGQRIRINGRSLRVRDLNRGDEIDIYLPPDRFVAVLPTDDQDFASTEEVVEYDIVEPAAAASTLPSTASPMPLIGLLGGLFTFIGAGGLLAFRSRKA